MQPSSGADAGAAPTAWVELPPVGRGRTQSYGRGSLQPGEAAGNAHDASVLPPRVGYFTESFEKYDDPKTWVMQPGVHRSLSAGKKGSQRQRLRAGQADHVLPQQGDPREMAAVLLRRASRTGSRPSRKPVQERYRLPRSAERTEPIGTPKTPATRSFAGWPNRLPTRGTQCP